MEKIQLKIGTNIGQEEVQFEIPVEIPETWEEVQQLDIPNEVKAACFNRGWRIKLQEDSGARGRLKESTVTERADKAGMVKILSEIIGLFISDPTSKKAGRKPTTKEVILDSKELSKDELVKFQALLANQPGIRVTVK